MLTAVLDTNVLYMFLYRPTGRLGTIMRAAIEGRIALAAPDTVAEELRSGILTSNHRHFAPMRRLAKLWQLDELVEACEGDAE
ncbi:hypothetical protein HY642_02520 [Candidatus Woesearchaeota archaeon]|nr:hypothetical protein [Candidatus Woesearchaeota archaeon]